jgi:hypothetical protein
VVQIHSPRPNAIRNLYSEVIPRLFHLSLTLGHAEAHARYARMLLDPVS